MLNGNHVTKECAVTVSLMYRVAQEKVSYCILSTSLLNIDQFSQFVYQ